MPDKVVTSMLYDGKLASQSHNPFLPLLQSVTANDQSLRAELTRDEGCTNVIYIDSVGKLTVGIGHLIVPGDPEYGKPAGTKVSDTRVQELFEQDLSTALADCNTVFSNFGTLPQEAQRIIANMMFNLGRPRFEGFKNFIAAVKAKNWSKAADEMVDSKWYGQVGDRSKRLVERMRSLAK